MGKWRYVFSWIMLTLLLFFSLIVGFVIHMNSNLCSTDVLNTESVTKILLDKNGDPILIGKISDFKGRPNSTWPVFTTLDPYPSEMLFNPFFIAAFTSKTQLRWSILMGYDWRFLDAKISSDNGILILFSAYFNENATEELYGSSTSGYVLKIIKLSSNGEILFSKNIRTLRLLKSGRIFIDESNANFSVAFRSESSFYPHSVETYGNDTSGYPLNIISFNADSIPYQRIILAEKLNAKVSFISGKSIYVLLNPKKPFQLNSKSYQGIGVLHIALTKTVFHPLNITTTELKNIGSAKILGNETDITVAIPTAKNLYLRYIDNQSKILPLNLNPETLDKFTLGVDDNTLFLSAFSKVPFPKNFTSSYNLVQLNWTGSISFFSLVILPDLTNWGIMGRLSVYSSDGYSVAHKNKTFALAYISNKFPENVEYGFQSSITGYKDPILVTIDENGNSYVSAFGVSGVEVKLCY